MTNPSSIYNIPILAMLACLGLYGFAIMPFWQTLFLLAASLVANEYLSPNPATENARPSNISDFDLPTTTEGRKIAVFWGRVRMDGPNVVWIGDYRQDAIFQTIKTGLWSKKEYLAGYRNYLAWQQVIGRGGGSNVTYTGVYVGDSKVWSGSISTSTSLEIDLPNLFGGERSGGGFQATIDFFIGSTTQAVSPFLSNASRQAITTGMTQTAPRYTGVAYMVIRELGVQATDSRGAYVGTSTNIRGVGAEVQRIPSLIPGQTAGQNSIGSNGDANLANCIYELLTNREWGLGRKVADFDLASWITAANTCVTEGNGFSMILEAEIGAEQMLEEMERQINGVVSRDLSTGKWIITLARADYDIDTVEQVNDTNSLVLNYTQSGWEDTTNEIQLKFSKRDDDYKEAHALAQDMANALIQGDGTLETALLVSSTVNFPGVKDSVNANKMVWRELRAVAFPMARCQVQVHRQFWNQNLGSVVAWSSEQYNITKKPMRVVEIDLGTIENDRIIFTLVEDTSYYLLPSYGEPAPSSWTFPEVVLSAIPIDEQIIIEAPRAIYTRDPSGIYLVTGEPIVISTLGHVFVSAARQSNEVGYVVYASTTPTLVEYNSVQQFMQIGTLDENLPMGESNPRSTMDVTAPVSVVQQMDQNLTAAIIGQELIHLIMIGNEFMLVTTSSHSSGVATLNNVYRGVLDSVQEAHSIGDKVYFLYTGSAMWANFGGFQGLSPISTSTSHRIELRPQSLTEQLGSGLANQVILTATRREIRPYAPGAIVFSGVGGTFGTPSLEGAGGGLNGYYIGIKWWRRALDNADEVLAVTADDAGVDATTEYRVEVRLDPDGADTQIVLTSWLAGSGAGSGGAFPAAAEQVSRLLILGLAEAGVTLRVLIRARYDFVHNPVVNDSDVADIESRYDLTYDFTPTSSLTGQFYFGGNLAVSAASAAYTAVATGSFTINVGASATVEARLNGGAWAAVVTAATTGAFAVTSGDTVEVRTTGSVGANFIELRNPSSVAVAYGTFA